MNRPNSFWALFLGNVRGFYREPAIIFWVFGFPILLALGLGIAFREKPVETIPVAIIAGPAAEAVEQALPRQEGFATVRCSAEEATTKLRLGKVALVVTPGPVPEFRFDPTRPDSAMAHMRVDAALQRAAGRKDPLVITDRPVTEPGARYIDFLIPGLLGMNIMSGGMWGVGFALVDMRIRKLLKRLAATPMKRSFFLGAIMSSRLLVVIIEMGLLLGFGMLVFGLPIHGSWALIAATVVLGGIAFSGLGMLVGSRVRKTESASGLINLVMLPQFVFSGIFFSSDRFPEVLQPLIKALPLTAFIDTLRAVILEGAPFLSQAGHLGVLLGWGVVSFAVALRIFRWAD